MSMRINKSGTLSEDLLNTIKSRKGMTYTEIRNHIAPWFMQPVSSGYWNSMLYGTKNTVGLFERFCKKDEDGKYQVVRKIERPFVPNRRVPRPKHL